METQHSGTSSDAGASESNVGPERFDVVDPRVTPLRLPVAPHALAPDRVDAAVVGVSRPAAAPEAAGPLQAVRDVVCLCGCWQQEQEKGGHPGVAQQGHPATQNQVCRASRRDVCSEMTPDFRRRVMAP